MQGCLTPRGPARTHADANEERSAQESVVSARNVAQDRFAREKDESGEEGLWLRRPVSSVGVVQGVRNGSIQDGRIQVRHPLITLVFCFLGQTRARSNRKALRAYQI